MKIFASILMGLGAMWIFSVVNILLVIGSFLVPPLLVFLVVSACIYVVIKDKSPSKLDNSKMTYKEARSIID